MMLFVVDIQLTFKLMNVILTLAGVEIRGSFWEFIIHDLCGET